VRRGGVFLGSTGRGSFRFWPELSSASSPFSPPMTTSHSRAGSSPSSSNGASDSSLSPVRSFLSMLNWRPVREIEQRTRELRKESERIRIDCERIRNDSEQIRKETEQIRKETERL
jgi:hypothetical protein